MRGLQIAAVGLMEMFFFLDVFIFNNVSPENGMDCRMLPTNIDDAICWLKQCQGFGESLHPAAAQFQRLQTAHQGPQKGRTKLKNIVVTYYASLLHFVIKYYQCIIRINSFYAYM